MNLSEYEKGDVNGLRKATLCFLVSDNKVLLAMKKRGFGAGRWNGVGGKTEKGESIEQTMVRETEEEILVTPTKYQQVGVLNFFFVDKVEWNQQVFVYLVNEWRGIPIETEEMAPEWFKTNNLPFAKMWPDDPYWLPRVLSGGQVEAEFLFGENDLVLDQTVRVH